MDILSSLEFWHSPIQIRQVEGLSVSVDFKIISKSGVWRMSTI